MNALYEKIKDNYTMNGILSQDEVDALLNGLSGSIDDNKDSSGQLDAVDFSRQERIIRGRMPALDLIHERLLRDWRINHFTWLRKSVDISIHAFSIIKYNDFIKRLPVPAHMNVISVKPWKGQGLCIIEPHLAFLWVDYMFGGSGNMSFRVEGREFTATEQRIILQGLDTFLKSYVKAWEPLIPLDIVYHRTEMHTQFINIVTPSELVAVLDLNVELQGHFSHIFLALPYSMLEPLKETLQKSHWVDKEDSDADNRWSGYLYDAMARSDVDVEVELGTASIPIRDVLTLKEGDVVMLTMNDPLHLTSCGIPVAECVQGTHNGHYAVRYCRSIRDE